MNQVTLVGMLFEQIGLILKNLTEENQNKFFNVNNWDTELTNDAYDASQYMSYFFSENKHLTHDKIAVEQSVKIYAERLISSFLKHETNWNTKDNIKDVLEKFYCCK